MDGGWDNLPRGGGEGQPREHVEEKVQVVRERMDVYIPRSR